MILWSSHSQTRKRRAGKIAIEGAVIAVRRQMARSNQLSKREPVLGALERGKRRTSVPAIASALTDLAEIDKFVKEQAEAIPFGRGSGIVSVIKAGGDAFDRKCGLPVCAALARRKQTDAVDRSQSTVAFEG